MVADEVAEIINMTEFGHICDIFRPPDGTHLVVPFSQQASHVAMSVRKLLARIVAPQIDTNDWSHCFV